MAHTDVLGPGCYGTGLDEGELSGGAAHRLTAAERRLLLIASVSTVDLAGVLLGAAAVDIDAVLTGAIPRLIQFDDGRYRFAHAATRSRIIANADDRALASAHVALARQLRRHELSLPAIWHASLATRSVSARHRTPLLKLAFLQLKRGAVDVAQEIATVLVAQTTGTLRREAAVLAARAALWAGRVRDVEPHAIASGDARADRRIRELIDVAWSLQESAMGDPVERIRHELDLLEPVVAVESDRAVFRTMSAWRGRRQISDLGPIAARAATASRRAHDGAWLKDSAAPSPLAEAYLRLLEATSRWQAGDSAAARAVIDDARARLPLHIPGGGAARALLREFGDHPGGGMQPPDTGRAYARLAQGLTAQERRVADLVGSGLSNHQISDVLGISERTVEIHLTRTYRKMRLRSRSELIVQLLSSRRVS